MGGAGRRIAPDWLTLRILLSAIQTDGLTPAPLDRAAFHVLLERGRAAMRDMMRRTIPT